jgi:lysophospholipid acyltransferase (LPLAT)-like uncharacterized protein
MEAACNHHIVIATDGPRGPRREVKDGIVYLAAQTGRAIVPVVFDGGNCWRPRGKWTDLIVPQPFSGAHMLAGAPIRVPERLTKEDRTHWRNLVQQAMDKLDDHVRQLACGASTQPFPAPVMRQRVA